MPDNEVNKIIGEVRLGLEGLERDTAKANQLVEQMFVNMDKFGKGNPKADFGMSKMTALQAAKVKAIAEKTEAEKTAILQKGEAQREVILRKANAPLESRTKRDLALAEKTSAQIQAIEAEKAAKISEIRSRQDINEAKALQEIAKVEKIAAEKIAIERKTAAEISAIKSKASISEEKALAEVAKYEKTAAEKVAIEQVANAKVQALRNMTEVSTQEKIAKTMAYVDKTNAARVSGEEWTQARIEALNKKTQAQIQTMQDKAASSMEHRHNTMLGRMKSSLLHHLGFMASGAVIAGIGIPMYEGLIKMETGMAGVAQVLPQLEHDQQLLNEVSEEYVNIMQRYGQNVQEVTDAAKLWGRQYKDIQTVQNLVNSTTLLSIVDNIGLAKSNQALEATMNQYGMTARNAAEATAYSMRIVDSWSNIAHNAQVSALDLAEANERSASVARKVGIEFDYLQGMIAASVRATGLPGANIGNMLKSVFGSIHSNKAVKEIEALGVKMKQVGKDGVESWRPMQDVIMDIIFATRGAKMDTENLTKAMAGGKFQWAKLAAMMGDFDTIIKATALSIHSQGKTLEYAHVQMDTIERKAKQLKATLVDLFNEGGNDGLRTGLKATIDTLNQFLMGLKQIEPYALKLAGLGAVSWGLVTVWKTMFTTLQPLVSSLVAARTATATLAAAETTQAVAAATATGAMTGLAIATGVATFGLSLLVGGIAAWVYQAGEAEKAQIDLKTAFEDEYAINQQRAIQYHSEADFLKNATGYREKLIAKIKDEKLSANDLMKTKNDLAAVEESMKTIVGEEAWARIQASKDKNKAMQDEINKINDLEKATKDASTKKINTEVETTNKTITEINKRITGYQTEISALMASSSVKQYYESLDQTKQAWDKEAAKDPYLAMRIQPPKSVSPLIKQTGELYNDEDVKKLTDLTNKKEADEKKLQDAIKQLEASKKKLMDLMNGVIQEGSDGGAASGDKTKADPLEPYRQFIDNLEYSFDYLKKLDPKTKQWLDPVRKVTDSVRVEIEKLKAKEDILKDSFEVNGKRVQDLTPIYVNHKSQVEALRKEKSALTSENTAYAQGLKQIDQQQKQLTVQYNNRQLTDKQYRIGIKLLTDERRKLDKAINDNIISIERGKKAESDLRKADLDLAQSAKEAARVRQEAIDKRWDNAYQLANNYMRHEVNMARWSTEQQIEFFEKLKNAHRWTQQQMWEVEENSFKLRKQQLDDFMSEMEKAYESQVDAVDSKLKTTVDSLKSQIDALEQGDKDDSRLEAKQEHDKKLAELEEQKHYHELRTGKEHKKAIVDLEKRIQEEKDKWVKKQDDWARDDKKENLQQQIEDVKSAAEKEKKNLEQHYKKVVDIANKGALDTLAALAATNPQWLETGKNWIKSLMEGISLMEPEFQKKVEGATSVMGGYKSQLPAETGSTPSSSVDIAVKEKAGIEIGPSEYTMMGDKAAMWSRTLAERLRLPVNWDNARQQVEIGNKWFTPLKNDNGKSYVGVRDVAESLGYSVDWDASKKNITIYKAAEGGVFMKPAITQIAEAGYPEVVIPLQRIQPMINTAVNVALKNKRSVFDWSANEGKGDTIIHLTGPLFNSEKTVLEGELDVETTGRQLWKTTKSIGRVRG